MNVRAHAATFDELRDLIDAYRITLAPFDNFSVSAGQVGGVWTADISVEEWL